MSETHQAKPLLLGVDGGGTSTLALLADKDGQVLGRGASGPSNPKAIGFESAFGALEAAISGAFEASGRPKATVEVACLGLAGFAQAEDQRRLYEWSEGWELTRKLLPVSDGSLVLAAGTPEGWGVAVIAGTGSIVVGGDQEGRTARAGGWGPLFGDEGSAYTVVLAALRRSSRRADGREPRPDPSDPLTDRFLEALGVAEPSNLISAMYAPSMDRTKIAALASVVIDAARDDPSIVADLLEPAGIDLGVTVEAVARALGWSGGVLPLALAGGFLLRSADLRRSLLGFLQGRGYDPRPSMVPNPVDGALILARREFEAEGGRI